MEEVVKDRVSEYMQTSSGCRCSDCRLDMIAMILNKLPPHYVRSDKGALYSKLSEFNPQWEVDLIVALEEAAKVIAKSPRHDDGD